jgi:predicted amidophosphoribosyltransferase
MAESAGRYCPLCGEAAGLVDRFCRRCGESLQVPGVRPGKSKLEVAPADEASTTRSTSRPRAIPPQRRTRP